MTPEELSTVWASGIRCLDNDFSESLPATCTRRIASGLDKACMWSGTGRPVGLQTMIYHTMAFLQLRRELRPRTALEPGTSEHVAQRFHDVRDLNKYSGLLASDYMTAAWDYLSDMGEKTLGAQAGHRRSSAPEVMTATEGHKASRRNESVVLRQLRRLLRRRQHLCSGCMSEYDQIHVRRHIRHNLTRLSGQWQELSSITWRAHQPMEGQSGAEWQSLHYVGKKKRRRGCKLDNTGTETFRL